MATLLATPTVQADRFNSTFSTKGARGQHGSKGSLGRRDPNQDDRVWVISDRARMGFASASEVSPIPQEAGNKSPPPDSGPERRPNRDRRNIYPEQYEGQEHDPLIFCTGPVPAQQVAPLIPWVMRRTGAKKFYLPAADYIWPRVMNQKVHEAATANGGTVVGEEYFPLDHTDYGETIERIAASGAEVVFNTTVPPGLMPFLEQLYESGFTKRGGHIVCTYFDENLLGLLPAEQVDGLYGCIDYYRTVSDPFSEELIARYADRFPDSPQFTAGSACTGMYRGLKLWQAAVTEAGSLEQADVLRALDHGKIAKGPGGPAEMVPGQHHVRMNMYIGQADNGTFNVLEKLGTIDPQESAEAVA